MYSSQPVKRPHENWLIGSVSISGEDTVCKLTAGTRHSGCSRGGHVPEQSWDTEVHGGDLCAGCIETVMHLDFQAILSGN